MHSRTFNSYLVLFISLVNLWGCGGPHFMGKRPGQDNSGSSSSGSSTTQSVDDATNNPPATDDLDQIITLPPNEDDIGEDNNCPSSSAILSQANELNSSELNTLNHSELPYFTQVEGVRRRVRLPVITLQQNSDGETCDIHRRRCRVRNAMVAMNVPVNLPAINNISVVSSVRATLMITLKKRFRVLNRRFDRTELLCMLNNDQTVCSGEYLRNRVFRHWEALINNQMPGFVAQSEDRNETYSDELYEEIQTNRDLRDRRHLGPYVINTIRINLAEAFGSNGRNLTTAELIAMLYGNQATAQPASFRQLQFVVADDVYVNSASLHIEFHTGNCQQQ